MRAKDPSAFIPQLLSIPEPSSLSPAWRSRPPLVKICGIRSSDEALAVAGAGADLLGLMFVEKSKRAIDITVAKEVSQAIRNLRFAARTAQNTPLIAGGGTNVPWFTMQAHFLHLSCATSRPLLVGVFQDAPLETVLSTICQVQLDIVQLHGSELIDWAHLIPIPVIRVFHIGKDGQGVDNITRGGVHQFVLLDTLREDNTGKSGGTGKVIDWELAKNIVDAGEIVPGSFSKPKDITSPVLVTLNDSKDVPGASSTINGIEHSAAKPSLFPLPVMLTGGLTPDNVDAAIAQVRPWAVDVSGGVENENGTAKDLQKVVAFIETAKGIKQAVKDEKNREVTEVASRNAIQVDQDSPELVERKIKGLLTMEKFTSISDQLIAWATHAIASPVHIMTHASNSLGFTPPSPTPSTPSMSGANRLDAGSRTFAPRAAPKTVTLKNADGTEVSLGNLNKTTPTPSTPIVSTPQSLALRQGSPGTPNRRSTSIRMETGDQHKSRLAEQEQKEARLKAEAAHKEKKEKEKAEAARKIKVAEEIRELEEAKKERIRLLEEELKERRRKEEEERLRIEAEARELLRLKEEEERRQEEERILKAMQEQKKALRLAQGRAKKEKKRKEKEEREEQERLSKVAEEVRLRLEEKVAAAKAKGQAIPEPEPEEEESKFELQGDGNQDGQVEDGKDPGIEAPKSFEDGKDKVKDVFLINTTSITSASDRRRPGPLDLASPISSSSPTARFIANIATVPYPEGVNRPHPVLNQNVKNGKFRYDREFLLQFRSVCKERPATLPPLDAIGLEPPHAMARGKSASGAAPPSRQASIGLGFTSSGFGKPGANSNHTASISGTTGMQYPSSRPSTLQRDAPLQKRVRTKRGENRNEKNRAPGGSGAQGHGSSINQQIQNLDPVAPLQVSENRWDRKAIQVDQDSPELVERKVKGLLNKLTMENFTSISDQLIAWANKSEKEKDGRTLIQVIRLVFEKATDEAIWSEIYARLCRKMMEQISTNVRDDGIKYEGKPITGGQLFRKYLLNRCQEDFERGWVAEEATAAAAATKALEDKAANAKAKEAGTEEIVPYPDEYCAAQKAKRQGLGLIKFIGELFKLQMLTERIMHECVKKMLTNVDNPEEEKIQSLCMLLTTVGSMLDTQKARLHLDVYFSRVKELTKSLNVTPRMQYMLQDLLELRERKWIARSNAVAAHTTIAQIHEDAGKEKAAQEKEFYQQQISMSRGGSRCGGDRGDFFQQIGPDGWAVAGSRSGPPGPPPKAGDLSNFGKIRKAQPLTFGPNTVFAGKKGVENMREAISRTSSNPNMFPMLSSQGAEASDKHKAAIDLRQQRKRLVFPPGSVPVEATSPVAESESNHPEEGPGIDMTKEAALKKIGEDSEEFFSVRNLEEAEVYFSGLPFQYHPLLVDKIVSTAVESKEDDAQLVSQFFALAVSQELCSAASFEQGLSLVAEVIEDIAIDAPKAFQLLAIMIKGADLDQERLWHLASMSTDGDKFLALLQ